MLGNELSTGANFIDNAVHTGNDPDTLGAYQLILSDIGNDTGATDATQEGLLFASSSRNENNFVSTRVIGVDTFEIVNKDNADPTLRYEEDSFFFVYVPFDTPDAIAMGHIDNEGDTLVGSGSYSISQLQDGEWFLSVPGANPDTATLILTGSSEDDNAMNNIISFELGTNNSVYGWTIQMRNINDLNTNPTGGMPLEGVAADTAAFSFAVFGEASVLDGDLNGDGFVGLDDLDIVLTNWNTSVTSGQWSLGDPSGDGFAGLDDLDIVLNNWNNGTPPTSTLVPEPTSLGLLSLGAVAILKRRIA